jgi:hypothetical protein
MLVTASARGESSSDQLNVVEYRGYRWDKAREDGPVSPIMRALLYAENGPGGLSYGSDVFGILSYGVVDSAMRALIATCVRRHKALSATIRY